jgi:hypothetical protein
VQESALQTAIWSVFQAKRRLLASPNGFKAKFYNLSGTGTRSALFQKCFGCKFSSYSTGISL